MSSQAGFAAEAFLLTLLPLYAGGIQIPRHTAGILRSSIPRMSPFVAIIAPWEQVFTPPLRGRNFVPAGISDACADLARGSCLDDPVIPQLLHHMTMLNPLPLRRLLVPAIGLLLVGALSTAHAATETNFAFKRGVNISHWLSQNDGEQTYGAPWFGESDVEWIARQGFDHIRLPVDFRLCLAADGSLDEAKLKPIADTIRWARARELGVVLDAHFLPGADFNSVGGDSRVYTDTGLQETAAQCWRQMARHFASEGPYLRFEILNEPVAAENKQLNPFMHRMLAAIRESNPTRIVYVTSNKWSSFHTVGDVVLPDDRNIALTIHYYEPLVFTHQRAPWVGFKNTLPPITFPGRVPDVTGYTLPSFHMKLHAGDELTAAQIEATFADVSAWLADHAPKIEVYVGEFGVYDPADAGSKRRWIATVRSAAESRGWGWAVWDYNDSFGVRKHDGSGTPVLEGLFTR
jgi:endoglucanase